MKVVEIVKIGKEIPKALTENGSKAEDYRYVSPEARLAQMEQMITFAIRRAKGGQKLQFCCYFVARQQNKRKILHPNI